MFEGILNTIGSIFGPVRDVIDDVHTSREEKERLKQELLRIELDARSEAMKHIQKLAELQSRVVLGEIQGKSWMQRNWRPILMLAIVSILVNNFIVAPYAVAFGLEAVVLDLPSELFVLMTVGVGGYIGGRTLEKRTEMQEIGEITRLRESAPD